MGHFLPFYASPPKNPTNEIFEKIKQIAGYIIRLHMCTKKTQLYGVQSLRYRVRQTQCFVPFSPKQPRKTIFWRKKILGCHHFTYVYQKSRSYGVCFLRYGARQTQFFVILDYYLLFYFPSNPENQNLEKIEKLREDFIILLMRTINENHMMYGSWDMECDVQNLLSFWTISWPFNTLATWKIWRCHHFLYVYQNCKSYDVWCMVPETWHATDSIFPPSS